MRMLPEAGKGYGLLGQGVLSTKSIFFVWDVVEL